MQRFIQDFLPTSFKHVWFRNNIRTIGVNEIQLRNSNRIQLPHLRLALTDCLPTVCIPRIWEQFPDKQIKIIRKKIEFDQKLKNFYIKDLATTNACNRLFCPSCSRI